MPIARASSSDVAAAVALHTRDACLAGNNHNTAPTKGCEFYTSVTATMVSLWPWRVSSIIKLDFDPATDSSRRAKMLPRLRGRSQYSPPKLTKLPPSMTSAARLRDALVLCGRSTQDSPTSLLPCCWSWSLVARTGVLWRCQSSRVALSCRSAAQILKSSRSQFAASILSAMRSRATSTTASRTPTPT